MNTPRPEVRTRLLKAGALVALIVALDVWLLHHYGYDLSHIATLSVVTVLVAVVTYVASTLSSTEKRWAEKAARAIAGRLLRTKVLVGLWVVFVIAVLALSSVTVRSETSEDVGSVSLTFPNHPADTLNGKLDQDRIVRFHLWIWPSGRSVRIAAPGFVETPFTVYPLTGLSVKLGEEVPFARALLLRPGHRGLVALKNGGSVRVWVDGPGSEVVVAETAGVKTSFMLGGPRDIPSSAIDRWRDEIACDSTDAGKRMLEVWKTPTVLHPRGQIPAASSPLHIEIRARNGDVVARTNIVVVADPFSDVRVPDLLPDPQAC